MNGFCESGFRALEQSALFYDSGYLLFYRKYVSCADERQLSVYFCMIGGRKLCTCDVMNCQYDIATVQREGEREREREREREN